MKKYIPLVLLVWVALACNAGISDVFGNGGEGLEDDFANEVEYARSLTATLFALETVITEATQTAAAVTETAQPGSVVGQVPTETPNPGDGDAFCAIYEAFIDDLYVRVDAYERAVVADDGSGHAIAVEADQAMEGYYDQLVAPAPPEIRASVEALAEMSLIGVLSSQEGVPAAEPHFEKVDNYAAENCDASLAGDE